MKSERSKLIDAKRARQFVRFSRRFETSPVRGYVLDVGPKLFLLALVSDRLWFDGFECFRVADVRNVREDPYAAFAEAALRKRRERVPRHPRVSVQRVDELLASAGRAFPLVTIHREQVDRKTCQIGRVEKVRRGRVSLLEIDPAAKWDEQPNGYRLSEITRVNFGGDYENALYLVGGSPSAPPRHMVSPLGQHSTFSSRGRRAPLPVELR